MDTVFSLINLDGTFSEKYFSSKSSEAGLHFLIACRLFFCFIEDSTKKNPFPCPTTFRTALTYYLDITSVPTTQLIKELAQYASNEEEKKQMQLMGSPSDEGKV